MKIVIKRVYEPSEASDGYRILVDRLWPRGVSKEFAALDEWRKDVAPSNELRHWFDHDSDKLAEFEQRYRAELDKNVDAVKELLDTVKKHASVTLLYGAKDPVINQARVLRDYLVKWLD